MIEGKNKLERWKQVLKHPGLLRDAILSLTVEQQLKANLVGIRWNMVGLAFAWLFLWFKGLWFFSISMAAVIFLQVIAYIGARQKWDQFQAAMVEAKNSEVFKLLEGR